MIFLNAISLFLGFIFFIVALKTNFKFQCQTLKAAHLSQLIAKELTREGVEFIPYHFNFCHFQQKLYKNENGLISSETDGNIINLPGNYENE